MSVVREMGLVSSVVLLASVSLACGTSEEPGSGHAGGADASVGTAGAGAGSGVEGGQGGGGSGGQAPVGGSPSSAGGTAGMDQAGVAGRVGTDGVDLTLDGLNQDLPMPARDCLETVTVESGCMSVSGEYNGEPFGYSCNDQAAIQIVLVSADTSRQIACAYDVMPDDLLRTSLKLGTMSFGPLLPTTFEAGTSQPADSLIALYRDERNVATFVGDDFQAEDTHSLEWAMAGEAFLGPGRTEENTAEYARGVFAMTLTPLPTCAPDAGGLGCDAVRVRGTFNVQTIPRLILGDEGDDCIAYPAVARCAEDLMCSIEPGAELGVCVPR